MKGAVRLMVQMYTHMGSSFQTFIPLLGLQQITKMFMSNVVSTMYGFVHNMLQAYY